MNRNFLRSCPRVGTACLGGLLSLALPIAHAWADDAKDLLKAMSDYMAKQEKFSFSYQSSIEAVTKDMEKLQFVSSGTVSVSRPDKIRVTRTGGFADLELVFDGTTLTVNGKNIGRYAQVEAKGTLDELGERLADAGAEPPGGDLLKANLYDALTQDVTQSRHIASANVGGVPCEYLAFRSPDTDWQIWIKEGAEPIPLRYVITSKDVAQAPQYTLEITDFKTGDQVPQTSFAFDAGASQKVDLSQIEMIDEVPSPQEEAQ